MSKLSIVMYHYVRPIAESQYPNIKGLEFALFKEQIQYFKDNFNVVTMQQVIDCLNDKLDMPKNAILLTFDDGYIDHYDYVFPILKKYGMQGSFFVPSAILEYGKVLDVNKIHFIMASLEIEKLLPRVLSIIESYRKIGFDIEQDDVLFDKLAKANRWDSKEVVFVKKLLQSYLQEDIRGEIVDRLFAEIVDVSEEEFSKRLYMNLEQIREMKEAGMFFGIHGEKHYWLNELSIKKMQEDINHSKSYFSEVLDEDYLVMNYPYGGYNDNVLNYVRKIGFKLGFSVEVGQADLKKDNPLILPRLDTNDFPPKSYRFMEV